MQPNLYQCPLSAPQTTLVPWKSLPAHVQFKLKASGVHCPVGDDDDDDIVEGKHDESPGIVEVPLEYLSPSGDDARPVKGNLSDKLTEYTRGMAGQRSRPFRPGGLGAEEVAVVSDKVDPYRTEEAIARSMRVLEQGSEASWKDGTLITAPPGVDFKVGLSFSDVRGKDDETTAAIDKGEEKLMFLSRKSSLLFLKLLHNSSRRLLLQHWPRQRNNREYSAAHISTMIPSSVVAVVAKAVATMRTLMIWRTMSKPKLWIKRQRGLPLCSWMVLILQH